MVYVGQATIRFFFKLATEISGLMSITMSRVGP